MAKTGFGQQKLSPACTQPCTIQVYFVFILIMCSVRCVYAVSHICCDYGAADAAWRRLHVPPKGLVRTRVPPRAAPLPGLRRLRGRQRL